MAIAHVALWTPDLDASARFWADWFGAEVGDVYESRRRPGFRSRFVRFADGPAIELMTGPWLAGPAPTEEQVGWAHVAITLGSEPAVRDLAERLALEGCLVSPPRTTGDGFYEAVIRSPEGALIEITA
ncbi:glyoxalase/bleomycin resistance/extradiol dioxygenase family protein [Siculibacillus lacustris]|uniref:Glyoxalase/bleomycin resistance/extradiol dioxygenase family protein n=1 Tax=Siculibacillus lacustris TaxID=1549641 RepID=A0A4Q9VUH1_9HYPH|nr:VOC family protein [Siculibacillus lacustris]TBW38678.1 glyoxalase/bleomycin resistance/extradiol dioxygenase family protein [Siculibacillus lacustris]